MREVVFADSFFYLALLNPRDQQHEAVQSWAESFSGNAVTTEAVLLEVADAFCGPSQRQIVAQMLADLRKDPTVEIIPFSADLMEKAWRLYETSQDKEWGITDCISFIVMRDRGLKNSLTSDHHFVQAAFRAIFAP